MSRMTPEDFQSALHNLDDGITVTVDGGAVRITATLSSKFKSAKIARDWSADELTPAFLAEVCYELGQIGERESQGAPLNSEGLPRLASPWSYV